LLGGVSAQLLNRFPYLSGEFDVRILYEQDYGMVRRFPAGVASLVPTPEDRHVALNSLRPDVTVVIDSPTFITAWRSAGSPGRLLLEVHTTTANLVYLKDKELLHGVSHIVTVSAYMEQLLRDLGLQNVARTTVIPNCLDERWREPTVSPVLGASPLVWVGKLDGHKRWRTALEVIEGLSEIAETAVAPIIVGGITAPEREVQALTTKLASSSALARTVWWPRVEYDRMPALYSAAGANEGVQLCTSTNESFGMAVAESLVRGCPVIAPSVGALPELLPQAALYQPGDWHAARDLAHQAIANKAFRDELLASTDAVRQLTEPKQVGDAYKAVLDQLLSGP
jgi:glycosyltransferase involved in cell wall biosynthesis